MNIAVGLLIIFLAILDLVEMKRANDEREIAINAEERALGHFNRIMKLNNMINDAQTEGKKYIAIDEIKKEVIDNRKSNNNF